MIDKINTNCLVQVNFLHFTYKSLTNHKISLPMNWGLHLISTCISLSYLYKKSAWIPIDSMYSGFSITQTVTCYMIGLLGCLILRISIFWLLVTLSKGYIATPFFKLTFVREKVWISTSNSYLSKCTEDCNTSTMYMNVTCITWHF